MYKWKKEEAQKEIVDPNVVYAEKTGYYCDLCGELIEEDRRQVWAYSRRRVVNGDQPMPVNTILPYIEVRSLTGSRAIDMCSKCSSEIMSKIAIHSDNILENLIQVRKDEILFKQEDAYKTYDDISRLREENANLHKAIDAMAYRND